MYSINSLPLEQVVTHKHLDVTFSSDLSWKYQVLTIAAKANKILGLLKRTFGWCSEAIITGYKTMLRPIIEYPCPVWNPHQAYLSDKLERIQRNVSRWILDGPIDYTERLQYLGWMELKSRRDFLSISLLMVFQELSLTIIYRSLVLALDQEIVRRFGNLFQELIF